MKNLVVFFMLFLHLSGGAQETVDSVPPVKKRFWRASGELLVTQLVPWCYNNFVREAEFAKVNFESIGHNLKPSSWEWDDNNFKTNQFAHPYHGNLYYSSFRTNGYSFWESVPAAFVGSFLWEVAGETHVPAPNDFINTSLGGITLGEMTYRLSNKVVNNRARGAKRQMQEVLGLVINPLNGINRIIDGQWGRIGAEPDSGNHLAAFLNVGIRRFNIRTLRENTTGNNEFYFRLRLNYGDKYKVSSIPFHSFSAQIEAGSGDSTYLNTVPVSGSLKTWKFLEDSSRVHMYSVTMNYDFIKNNAFEYGGQGIMFKLMSNWSKKRKTKIFTEIGSGVVVLGAVQDKYLYYGEGRNYDYGPGISVAANVIINFDHRLEVELNYKGSRFQTANGNKSSFILNTLSADLRANFTKRFLLAAGIGQYTLNGFYTSFQNVSEIYPFFKVSLGYQL